jgi:hypothetical protein
MNDPEIDQYLTEMVSLDELLERDRENLTEPELEGVSMEVFKAQIQMMGEQDLKLTKACPSLLAPKPGNYYQGKGFTITHRPDGFFEIKLNGKSTGNFVPADKLLDLQELEIAAAALGSTEEADPPAPEDPTSPKQNPMIPAHDLVNPPGPAAGDLTDPRNNELIPQ